MTTDKMREDFEKAANDYALTGKPKEFQHGFTKGFTEGYQAATAESTAKIAQMQARIDELVEVLNYVGYAISGKGAPPNQAFSYTEITKCQLKISEALAKVKDVK